MFQGNKFISLPVKKSSKKSWFPILFFLVILIIFLVTLIGFFVFQKNNQPKWESEKIKLEIKGSKEAASGEEVEYLIDIKNQGDVALNNPEISISFPQGFVFISAEPEFSQKLISGGIWSSDVLTSSQNEEMKIRGKIFGEINESKIFSLALNYQPENFSSTFLETSSYETKIVSSLINMEFDFPEKIISGGEIEGTIRVEKNKETKEDLKNIMVALEYPYGFKIIESETEIGESEEENTILWKISELKDKQEIKFKGSLEGEVDSKKNFKVKTFSLDKEGEALSSFIEVRKIVQLITPPLTLNLKINDLHTTEQNIKLGDELVYEIGYQNEGNEALEDIILQVDFIGDNVLDWNSLEFLDSLKNVDLSEIDRGQQLVFSKEQVTDFSTLEPGKKGIIKFRIRVADKISVPKDSIQFFFQVTIFTKDFRVKSNPINFSEVQELSS